MYSCCLQQPTISSATSLDFGHLHNNVHTSANCSSLQPAAHGASHKALIAAKWFGASSLLSWLPANMQLDKPSSHYYCIDSSRQKISEFSVDSMHMAGPGVGGQAPSGPPGFAAPQPVRTSSTGAPSSAFRPPSPAAGIMSICNFPQLDTVLTYDTA